MARKKYTLGFEIDSAKAEAAARRVNAAMQQIDKSAAKAAATLDRAMANLGNTANAAANAAASAANRGSQSATAAANASAKAQAQAAAQAARAQQQAAAQAAKAAQQAANQQARAAAQAAKAQAQAAAQAQKAQQQAAAQATKAAQQAARAQQQAAAQTARAQQQAANQAARAAAQAAKASQQAANQQARAQAQAAAQAQRAQAAAARAAAAAQRAQDRLVTKSLTDQEVRQKALNALMRRSNKARVDEAMKALDTEKAGFLESAAGALGLEGALTKVGIAAAGVGLAIAGIRELAKVFNSVRDASLDMAKQTLDTLGSLREIAAIKEKFGPDKAELAQHLKVRVGSGLSHQEAVAFQTELYNSLGTVSKEKLDDKQRAELEIQGAKTAARTGGGTEGVATRAGTMGLLPDFMQGKNLKAGEVVDMADKVDVILGRGAGSPTQVAQQFRMALTTLGSDKLQGKMKNPAEIASMVALATKVNPGEAATFVGQMSRGLERLTKLSKAKGAKSSQAESLKEAGIVETDDPRQKLEKMFKLIDKKGGEDRAVKVLMAEMGFGSEQEKRSFEAFYNEYKKGNYQTIMGLADEAIKPGAAGAKNEAFQKSMLGRNLIAEAKLDEAKIGEGERGVEYTVRKKEAEAELIKEQMDTSVWGGIKQTAAAASVGWQRSGRDVLIDMRVRDKQREELKAAGAKVGPSQRELLMNDMASSALAGPMGPFDAVAKAGFRHVRDNLFSDTAGEVNKDAEMLEQLKKVNANLEKGNAQQGGKAPAAAPVANPQRGAPSVLGSLGSWIGF